VLSKGIPALLVGALVAMLAVGCGGGSSGGDTEVTVSSMSKAEFIKKADAVCKKGSEAITADYGEFLREHKGVKNPTEALFSELVDRVVAPNLEREVEEIRALGAPKGQEARVEAVLAAVERSLTTAEEEPRNVINDMPKVFGEADKVAKQYGFRVCGSTR
jgi:hypothetical protein